MCHVVHFPENVMAVNTGVFDYVWFLGSHLDQILIVVYLIFSILILVSQSVWSSFCVCLFVAPSEFWDIGTLIVHTRLNVLMEMMFLGPLIPGLKNHDDFFGRVHRKHYMGKITHSNFSFLRT